MLVHIRNEIILESRFRYRSLALLNDGVDERAKSPADKHAYVVAVLQVQCGLANETDALWRTCHDD